MTRLACLVGLIAGPAAAAPLDRDPGDLRPGLVAEYRSVGEPRAAVTRVERKPAFTLGESSPHPRIPPGPLEVVYTGVLSVRDAGPLSFAAFVGGEVTVTVDGEVVLDGRGRTETTRIAGTKALTRDRGHYPVTIRFRSVVGVPARLQVWWEGPGFAAEVIPAWRFGHLPGRETPALERGSQEQHGRDAVGRYGCARCHASALPDGKDPPPGPALADGAKRLNRSWVLDWLADPAKVRPGAHMPGLFADDRTGFVERWLIADHLTGGDKSAAAVPGDHRTGRLAFLGVGCHACHFVPDVPRTEQPDLNRKPLVGLGDRFPAAELAAFLADPHARYPDGRMPKLTLTPAQARDIAAYLLLWSKPTARPKVEPPTARELDEVVRRTKAGDAKGAAVALLAEKGCVACHEGPADARPKDLPIRDRAGCLDGSEGPRFSIPADVRKDIEAYVRVAPFDRHPAPVAERQRQLARAGCVQCHQRDTDRPPPIEEAGSKLGGAHLMELPYLRTPRLTNPHQKLTRAHLSATVKDGNPNLRWARYTYKMPAFGARAEALVRALAEADGELVAADDAPAPGTADPTLGTLHGSRLAGFQGYACASCHVWNGKQLASADPAAIGPDLTRTAGRLRRDWFDRFVEDPLRYYPGTPMPSVFPHGQPATLATVLDGDAAKQKDALWALLALGKDAPSPKPPPPVPVDAPAAGEPVIVAQIPLRFPDGKVIESLSVLSDQHDLLVYDLATGSPFRLLTGGQILRNVQGRIRQFLAAGTPVDLPAAKVDTPLERTLLGYDRLIDGVRVRWRLRFAAGTRDVEDTLRLTADRRFIRETEGGTATIDLPPAARPPAWDQAPATPADFTDGSLERPGYRAVAYPRPKTVSGEDRVMPGAVAVRPKDGQVFVASMKTGELFALRNPAGGTPSFENYGRGLFQDALSMLAEDDGLYVLHRRNLTKVTDDGKRFDRVAALPHGVADTYDMAYGLARDKAGRFVFGYAPYANQSLPGSGGAVRLTPGKPPEEVAFGMRNPLGWCAGPDGEVFFTDNQGDWVASNKLCHVETGEFYGWPNSAQKQHATKPAGKAAVWV
ncbi:MAG TPA: hypothetical protein VM597_28275, partial [Gemmataceae bacterium]|nr:hypothetical protein [Gemmataceae bacterium]